MMRAHAAAIDSLLAAFHDPPRQARTHCYWWWLNGNTDEVTITRDLEQMRAKGYGGAILIDANGSNQFKNNAVPAGPMFGSDSWRKLYRHAIREAARLNLEISLTIQSGWNLGGPTVTPDQASKILTFSRVQVNGPMHLQRTLEQPGMRNGFYRDIAVLAYPLHAPEGRPPIRQLAEKAAFKEFGRSMPETSELLADVPSSASEEDYRVHELQNLTPRFTASQPLQWDVPKGKWEILRIGYTDSGAMVSTASGDWQGLAIDHLDHTAFEAYWMHNVLPLIRAADPYVGKSLRYLVTDSWELGGTNWAAHFAENFQRRRGYDLLPYLPVVTGRIAGSRDESDGFLNDFRKTIGDMVRDEHYGVFARLAKAEGLGIHPESGGPHGAPIDALRTLGLSTFPQTEFWARSATHRSTDEDRFFIKEAASAAHTYGKTIAAGEGMTSIGPQWEEAIWNDLKPTFDQAVCSGLNLLFWHTFTSAPKAFGLPGREYFAGTHLNPNVTWWNYAGPFISYINRTQAVMQSGLPVADVLYYYGDRVPNFVQLQAADPAKILPGYDFDVVDENVLTAETKAVNGNINLTNGTSYRLLVLGQNGYISLAALRKIRELVSDGAVVLGDMPRHLTGLGDETEFHRLADELWNHCGSTLTDKRNSSRNHVVCGTGARSVLTSLQLSSDFESQSNLDYIHRRLADADIYFVRNTGEAAATTEATFRVKDKAPALLHADTGSVENLNVYTSTSDHRTAVPLDLEPYGSAILVFENKRRDHLTQLTTQTRVQKNGAMWTVTSSAPGPVEGLSSNGLHLTASIPAAPAPEQLDGPWTLHFPPGWNAPAATLFPRLTSWTDNAEAGVRYFSGTATYTKDFELAPGLLNSSLVLDLGEVREFAQVVLNGKNLGVLWKKPFRIDIGKIAKPATNHLTIAVTNLWPNRLIGDQLQPPEKRLTKTNITKFRADSPLLPSGLLGPVRLIPSSQPVPLRAR